MADRRVPGDKAERRRAEPEEENVRQIQRIGETAETRLEIEEPAGRQHKEQPVEKRAPRRLDRWVAKSGDLAREDRVEPPDQRRQKRQQVAARIQRERAAVKADETDACHRYEKSHEEIRRQPLLAAQKKCRQHRREKRRHRHDHAHV